MSILSYQVSIYYSMWLLALTKLNYLELINKYTSFINILMTMLVVIYKTNTDNLLIFKHNGLKDIRMC